MPLNLVIACQLKLLDGGVEHFAVFAFEDTAGEAFNKAVAMRGHKNSGSALVDLLEDLHDAAGNFRIQVASGFVSQEDLRFIEKGAGNNYALLFSA